MSSSYSNLKIQLMATGENATTWGNVTNLNLGTALEEAIVGSADVTFASANVTLTLTDTNASQTARNLRLNCIGTTGGARNLVVPDIQKPYLIVNGCGDTITAKTSAGTGIAVPAGRSTWVYCDGTNVVDPINHLISLTVAADFSAGGNAAIAGNATVGGNAAVTGTFTAGNIVESAVISSGGTVGANTIGLRGIPQSTKSTGYTLALSDAGKQISTTANVTIPANASVAFPVGTAIAIYNSSGSSISVPITTDTLRLAGTALTGTRVIAAFGLASILKVGVTTWTMAGAGVA